MANIRTIIRSFGGGEVSPEMFGRFDDVKYQSGLATCKNFIVKPQGPAENRAGFQFVREVKDSTKRVRLIPFTYSTTQTMVIEVGDGYMRFHTSGATLMSGLSPYEVSNTYAEGALFDIHHVQSSDVLTMVHPSYAPKELRRLGATNWTFTSIDFSPAVLPPGSVSVSAYLPASSSTSADTKVDMIYVVTSVASDGLSESVSSAEVTVQNNIYVTGAYNTISWAAASGAIRYNVYKNQGGLFGYIGETQSTSLVDDNIAPDLGKTPPIYDAAFAQNGIASVPVTSGGTGYGTGYTGGEITAVAVTASGSGYTSGVTLTVSDPTGSGATFTVTRKPFPDSDEILSITVTSQGSGYTNPTFVFSDSGGSGAAVSATVNPASNLPTLSVSDSTGTGAVLSPTVSGGVITGIRVVNAGQNYTAPTVSVSAAAGGSGAVIGTPVLTGVDYPGAVSYFEQRRCFAGTNIKPQNLWMTMSGTESNLSYSLPLKDDDRISFRVAAREANMIRHIVPLSELVLLTSAAEWRVTSVNSDAITPTTTSVKPQAYIGASNVQPVIAGSAIVYGAARGGHVMEFGFNSNAGGYVSGDLCWRASHLFDGFDIVDMAYAKAPVPIVWFVRSDGVLLGLTYIPDQQVGAWHQHTTDGLFESCCVVAEGDEDVLYVVVRRTIGGVQKRYVERMASRQVSSISAGFFVDSGLTYSGAPATTITGLSHLEGETVAILADGVEMAQQVVSGGSVTLDGAASLVHAGLPITAEMVTLPVAAQLDGSFGQGRAKNVNKAWIRVFLSSVLKVGPSFDKLVDTRVQSGAAYVSPMALVSQEIPVMTSPAWAEGGQVYLRHTSPTPLTVVSLATEVSIGG